MHKKQVIQLLLAGCASVGLMSCTSPQNYSKAVNTWNGAPESALFQQWGHPHEVKHLHNGNHLDIYRIVERTHPVRNYSHHVIGPRTSPQNSQALVMSHVPPVMLNHGALFWCDTEFEVNKFNMIVNTHFTGNNCVVTQHGVKRWAY